jgi:hypothetical protein
MAKKKTSPVMLAPKLDDENGGELRSSVTERLLWLEKRDGVLMPDAVIEDARNPKSPLHEEFEWNLKVAALRHWVDRARELIRAVRLEIRTTYHKISAIGFLHDPSLPPQVAGYKSIHSLRQSKVEARAALRQECLRASASLRRAREVAVALNLENEVEAILASVMQLIRAA